MRPATLTDSIIDNDEPTAFDQLGRDTELLALSRVILNSRAPLVLGVHGDWGEGKTSFMQILQRLLSPEGRRSYKNDAQRYGVTSGQSVADEFERHWNNELHLPTVWFNPWQYQFEEEPILPLLDSIRAQVPPTTWGHIKSTVKDAVEDPKVRVVAKAALGIGKLVGPGWMNALSGGYFDFINKSTASTATRIFNDFTQVQDKLSACFRQILEHFPAESGTKPSRMVIFIDDLDRCESQYVVKILETLKLQLINPYCIYVVGCANSHIVECLIQQQAASSEPVAQQYLGAFPSEVQQVGELRGERRPDSLRDF